MYLQQVEFEPGTLSVYKSSGESAKIRTADMQDQMLTLLCGSFTIQCLANINTIPLFEHQYTN